MAKNRKKRPKIEKNEPITSESSLVIPVREAKQVRETATLSWQRRSAATRTGQKHARYRKSYCKKVKSLLSEGLRPVSVQRVLGIPQATYYRWMKDHLEFQQAVLQGVDFQRAIQREDSIHKRCTGYRYPEVKREVLKYKDHDTGVILPDRDPDGKPRYTVTQIVTKELPPDGDLALRVSAIRHPDRWSEKRRLEITGKNGAPLLAGGNGAVIDMKEIMKQIWAEANPALLPHQQPVYDPEFDGQNDTSGNK